MLFGLQISARFDRPAIRIPFVIRKGLGEDQVRNIISTSGGLSFHREISMVEGSMFAAVKPYPARLLGPIITAIFAERINQRQRFDARKVPTYRIDQITAKIAAVNFLDGVQLLDKVVEFHKKYHLRPMVSTGLPLTLPNQR